MRRPGEQDPRSRGAWRLTEACAPARCHWHRSRSRAACRLAEGLLGHGPPRAGHPGAGRSTPPPTTTRRKARVATTWRTGSALAGSMAARRGAFWSWPATSRPPRCRRAYPAPDRDRAGDRGDGVAGGCRITSRSGPSAHRAVVVPPRARPANEPRSSRGATTEPSAGARQRSSRPGAGRSEAGPGRSDEWGVRPVVERRTVLLSGARRLPAPQPGAAGRLAPGSARLARPTTRP